MGYAGNGWGMGFGVWCTMIVLGFILFYFLRDNSNRSSSAQDILDKRYANGDINRQEYEEKSNALNRIA
ncbi:MAG: SHOCT domain-containing protein [Sulfurovum sp.]|nr:hypothetical protein [Sulfurovum sp.]NNJ45462.1 SHOCT domain-containing protein [Sulfurovum sp.]